MDKSLREAAAACLRNVESLHEEAELLEANGYEARAVALAIIGVEEFAKAVAYTLAALFPDQGGELLSRLKHHEVKHLIAADAEAAEIETFDFLWGSYPAACRAPSTPGIRRDSTVMDEVLQASTTKCPMVLKVFGWFR